MYTISNRHKSIGVWCVYGGIKSDYMVDGFAFPVLLVHPGAVASIENLGWSLSIALMLRKIWGVVQNFQLIPWLMPTVRLLLLLSQCEVRWARDCNSDPQIT